MLTITNPRCRIKNMRDLGALSSWQARNVFDSDKELGSTSLTHSWSNMDIAGRFLGFWESLRLPIRIVKVRFDVGSSTTTIVLIYNIYGLSTKIYGHYTLLFINLREQNEGLRSTCGILVSVGNSMQPVCRFQYLLPMLLGRVSVRPKTSQQSPTHRERCNQIQAECNLVLVLSSHSRKNRIESCVEYVSPGYQGVLKTGIKCCKKCPFTADNRSFL